MSQSAGDSASLRDRLVERVAPVLARAWPSAVRDDDSLIMWITGRVADAVLSVLAEHEAERPVRVSEEGGDRGWKPSDAPTPFFVRCADALFAACEKAIRSGRIDARSPIGDAAVDYRQERDEMAALSVPSQPKDGEEMVRRSDALADLEAVQERQAHWFGEALKARHGRDEALAEVERLRKELRQCEAAVKFGPPQPPSQAALDIAARRTIEALRARVAELEQAAREVVVEARTASGRPLTQYSVASSPASSSTEGSEG